MTPIIGAPPGTYFTLRIYKKLTTNPALSWANTYEVTNNEPVEAGFVDSLISVVSEFERMIHLGDVQFDRAILSSWVEDGTPYDPTTFITKPLTLLGSRVAGGQALSLNNCLFVRRETAYGQNGKLFYRRVMTEEDVLATSGTLALSNPVAMNTEIQAAVTAANVDGILNFGLTWGLRMKSALLLDREVSALTVAGARMIQFNNRYFDVP